MVNGFLRFENEEAFNAWNEAVNLALGYPNPQTRTLVYTSARLGTDGALYAPINDGCPEALRAGQDFVTAEAAPLE